MAAASWRRSRAAKDSGVELEVDAVAVAVVEERAVCWRRVAEVVFVFGVVSNGFPRAWALRWAALKEGGAGPWGGGGRARGGVCVDGGAGAGEVCEVDGVHGEGGMFMSAVCESAESECGACLVSWAVRTCSGACEEVWRGLGDGSYQVMSAGEDGLGRWNLVTCMPLLLCSSSFPSLLPSPCIPA